MIESLTGRCARWMENPVRWLNSAPLRSFDVIVTPALGVLFGAILWFEHRRPLRRRTQSHGDRLKTNAGLGGLAMLAMCVVLLPAVFEIAAWAERNDLGLTRLAAVPGLASTILAVLLMDYTTYVWHRLNHAVPFLWRFHSVHHTDLDLDVFTAFRFHVGEIVLSVGARSFQVAIVGVGPAVALVWEVAELAATEFHHSNIRLPLGFEQALNRLLVTPRMHGTHHSIVERETNSNWSVMFSWWDRVHRTLRLDVPQRDIVIGLPAYREQHDVRLRSLLVAPFVKQRAHWRLPSGEHPDRNLGGDPRRLAA